MLDHMVVVFFIYLFFWSEEVKWSRSVVSHSLWPHGLYRTRLLRPWDSPGKNTGVGCHCLLQGIFPTQGSNPGLLHCRQTLYPLSHQGSQKLQTAFQSSYTIGQSALKSMHVFTWKKCLCGIRIKFKLNLGKLSSSLLLLSHLPFTFCLPFSFPPF